MSHENSSRERPVGHAPRQTERVRVSLLALARRLDANAKLPGVRELCRELQTSASTLASALTELEGEGVLMRRQSVGIFVAPGARIQRPARVLLVAHPAFFSASQHSPFWDLLQERMAERASEYGESFDMRFTRPGWDDELPPDLDEEIRRAPATGLGVLGIGILSKTAEFIQQHAPLVTFAAESYHIVRYDEEALLRQGILELAKRGCRRIGVWWGVPMSKAHRSYSRFKITQDDATLQALSREVGLPWRGELVRRGFELLACDEAPGLTYQEQGYALALRVFGPEATETAPDGLLSTDDLMTRGALVRLSQLGLQVGRDVHVATHSNLGSDSLLGWEQHLTQMCFDPQDLVSQMFAQLDAVFAGTAPLRPSANQVINVQPRLIAPASP